MELSPEIKAQLEEQKKNCIFCQIIEGKMEGKQIYSDKEMVALLDIRPAVKGHLLVMPKEHYPIMPLIPTETFQHMFGTLPQIIEMVKRAMVMTGVDVFIANGGVAGQQSPHFLFHIYGRDDQDGIMNYLFMPKKQPEEEQKRALELLQHNLPLMIQNNFKKTGYSVKESKEVPAHLMELKESNPIIYEDEKVLVIASPNPQCVGHVEIYSKEEEKYFENLSSKSAYHMFYTASFAATALFEGLKAQGTNIIMKTGKATDNEDERLVLHVIQRKENDGLDLMLKPGKQGDVKEIESSYSDHSYKIGMQEERTQEKEPANAEDEIKKAIKELRIP